MTSSIYAKVTTFSTATIPIVADTDILADPIVITSEDVSPGGGGILRIYFGFDLGSTLATVSVFNNGNLKGELNADNSAEVATLGYYRFDIDVEAGDSINLQADETVLQSNSFVRAHLVQFGA